MSARRRTSHSVSRKWRQRTRCWSQKARGGWLAIFSTTTTLGAVTIKGLAEPVMAAQVLSESTVESRFEALRSATLSPLVGRDEEVQLLLRRWAQAKDGEGQIVLISGEAGIGKSRIVAALQERLEPERPVRLRYFCSPHRRDSALFPIIARLERAAGFTRDDAPRRNSTSCGAAVPVRRQRSGNRGRVRRLVGATGRRALSTTMPDDPRQKRERIFVALVRQLEKSGAASPCAVSVSRTRTGAIRPRSICWIG